VSSCLILWVYLWALDGTGLRYMVLDVDALHPVALSLVALYGCERGAMVVHVWQWVDMGHWM
jgi:hypothetical protein